MTASPCCVRCGAGLSGRDGRRRPKFCSVGCRRTAEYEVRRLVRRLERVDDRLAELREVRAGVIYGFSLRRERADADAAHFEAERRRAEDRLAELLGEHDQPT